MQSPKPTQRSPFFSRTALILALIFLVPGVLTALGYLALGTGAAGTPPGRTTTCERVLSNDLRVQLSSFIFSSGLDSYADQRFSVWRDEAWQPVLETRVQRPGGADCQVNIIERADQLWLWTELGVAVSEDGGETWRSSSLCDLPRPEGRCAYDYRLFTFELDDSSARIEATGAQQRYRLVSDDLGQSWQKIDVDSEQSS